MTIRSATNQSLLAESLERTSLPLHLQVAALLRQRIEKREWKVGEKLPSMEQLATQIPVSRLTIRQALGHLEVEGLVRLRQGSGTYLVSDLSAQRWCRVATDWNSLISEILQGTQTALEVHDPLPFPEIFGDEGRLASKYRYIKRLNLKDGVPFSFMTYHIAASVFDLDPQAFLSGPVLPILAKMPQVNIGHARQTMHVASADPEASHLLRIDLSAPVVIARRIVVDTKRDAIFVGHITYRGDYVRFEVDLNFSACRN